MQAARCPAVPVGLDAMGRTGETLLEWLWEGQRHRASPLTVQLSLLFAGALARAVLQ